MKKCFTAFAATLAAFALFAVSSCCGDDLPPDAVGFTTHLVNKENGSINNIEDNLEGMVVCLRNSTTSSGIIAEKKTDDDGRADFTFCKDRPFRDEIFVSDEEYSAIFDRKTDYYLVINDPESSLYNSAYETKLLKFHDGESLFNVVYLPSKSN